MKASKDCSLDDIFFFRERVIILRFKMRQREEVFSLLNMDKMFIYCIIINLPP